MSHVVNVRSLVGRCCLHPLWLFAAAGWPLPWPPIVDSHFASFVSFHWKFCFGALFDVAAAAVAVCHIYFLVSQLLEIPLHLGHNLAYARLT